MPRKSTPAEPTPVVIVPEPCSSCSGSGQTPQTVTGSRKTVRGQMGVCLTCFGTGQNGTQS